MQIIKYSGHVTAHFEDGGHAGSFTIPLDTSVRVDFDRLAAHVGSTVDRFLAVMCQRAEAEDRLAKLTKDHDALVEKYIKLETEAEGLRMELRAKPQGAGKPAEPSKAAGKKPKANI